MVEYNRKTVKEGAYAKFSPACMCGNDVPLELVAQTFANGTIHYLLGCSRCGKLGVGYLAHRLVSEASKRTAKPYKGRA